MLQKLPVHTPIIAAVTILIVILFVAGIKMGVPTYYLAIFFLAAACCTLSLFLWSLHRRLDQRERHVRQLRFVADRFQAMVRSLPGGYCLFTPQGLLREEVGVAPRLGVEKITHFDEIVVAIREGAELTEAFRAFQRSGEKFSQNITTLQGNKALIVKGHRIQIGRDGPQVDILWFNEVLTGSSSVKAENGAISVAEEKLREVQAAFDTIPFPVWGRSQDLKIAFCNEAYAKAMDCTIADVLREQHELMSQTARGGSGRALAANALGRGEPQIERRHVILAGKRRLLEIAELPYKTDEKTAERVPAGMTKLPLLGFAIDVTVEEEKDTELQRHLAAQHEVMEHLGSAIAIYGSDTRLEFYNRAYVRLWECDEAFLSAKPTFGEVLEDLRTRRRLPEQADFQRYKKERQTLFTSLLEPHEDLIYLPDGTSLRVLAVPHPFGGIMFVHEDVTDRLALETSYNTLIAVQRETLDNLAEGIAVFGPDGKLRLSNPSFARIWNLAPDYLTKAPHIADILEQMKPLFNFGGNWAQFKNETVAYTLDRNPHAGRIERADNAIIEFQTLPLPDGAVLNSYLDVTDTARVEQALRASNAALAAADRLKSEFVANVSYQLRTPLNTISGFADILTEQYFGTLNERQLEYTRTIKEASESLLRLINDVLDLATIEAGRMTLDLQKVSVADMLNAVKHMASGWARQQALEMRIDCPTDIGFIEVDEQRIRQILFHLISNSIKYTPAGGSITLEAKAESNNFVALSVIDTGMGIPEGDCRRVFGKFERANLHARQSGAGLGLSLVKSFVELHGGHIEISSVVDKGTRVCFVIPRRQAVVEKKEITDGNDIRVLPHT